MTCQDVRKVVASFCSYAVGSGVASILARKIVHKTFGIAQCLGRDFTLFRLLSQPFAAAHQTDSASRRNALLRTRRAI